ncbi:MAG: PIN domain-containing protein [Solirubrobacterales bacterium]
MLLLDASIWVASGARENRWHESASRLIRRPPGPLGAIDLTLYEVANAVGVRGRNPDAARVLTRILQRRCRDRVVALDAELLELTLEVAAEYGLSAYDAAYVAAARRSGWQLISIDIRDLVSKGLAVTPDAADYP